MARKRKLDLPDWRRFSGFLSYSYTVGNAWFPVTGGLFLGDDATAAEPSSPAISRIRRISATPFADVFATRSTPRFWIAGGIQYDTGLPFEFDGDPSDRCSPNTASR